MRGALESHRPVEHLQKVVTDAQNLTNEAGAPSANQTDSSTPGTLGKLDTMPDISSRWDNSYDLISSRWDNSVV